MSPRDLPKSTLAAFLRTHGGQIVSLWDRAERRRSSEPPPGCVVLREELPAVLERIAERLDAAVAASFAIREDGERDSWTGFDAVAAELPEPVLGHRVFERLRDGFDLEDATAEYALLRRCVLRILQQSDAQPSWLELTILHEALDEVMIHPAARSAAARERALAALDRISAEPASNAQIDRQLRRLLEVLVESVRSIDWVTLLLLEGEVLRVRAALGVDEAMWSLRSYKLAEGFVGRVVRERRPVALRSAAPDPLATEGGSGAARADWGAQPERPIDALHALYGVPLLFEGRLVGVAVVSSRRVAEFSEGGRLLIRKAADRAAALVAHAQLREQLAMDRSRFDATIQRLDVGVGVADAPSGAIVLSNRRFSEIVHGPDEIPTGTPARSLLTEADDDQRARWVLFRALHGGETAAEEIEFVRGDGDRRLGRFSAVPVRDSEGRIASALVLVDDVTERRRSDEGRALLFDACGALVDSLDPEGSIERVVRLAGERFADVCVLDLVGEAGDFTRPLAVARLPAGRALAQKLLGYPPRATQGSLLAEVVSLGEVALVPLITDVWLQRVASGAAHLAALRELAPRSAILVPLAARGRKLGLLSLLSIEHELRKEDVSIASALGRVVSLAVDRARR